MPKIHKKSIYGDDPNISLDDYLIGTNGNPDIERRLKTQSFPLRSIAALISTYIGNIGINQNNVGRLIPLSLIGTPTLVNITAAINALPAFTVSEFDDMWFDVTVTDVNRLGQFVIMGKNDKIKKVL